MKVRCNIPRTMRPALNWLLVDHHGLEAREVWSLLVSRHASRILEEGFQSLTSQINDAGFYQDNYQDEFEVNDEHRGFFTTTKALKITRVAARQEDNKKINGVRSNNGAVLREVFFQELLDRNYMKINDSGRVTIQNSKNSKSIKSNDD